MALVTNPEFFVNLFPLKCSLFLHEVGFPRCVSSLQSAKLLVQWEWINKNQLHKYSDDFIYTCFDEFPKETRIENHICTVPAPSASPPRSDAPRSEMNLSLQHERLLCFDGALLARGQPPSLRCLLVCLFLTTIEFSDQTHFTKRVGVSKILCFSTCRALDHSHNCPVFIGEADLVTTEQDI